jgi:cysteine desulfuration protein SufE
MLEKLNDFLEEFKSIDDRDTRFDYLIEVADRFKEVPTDVATRPFSKDNLVPACESEAYVFLEKNNNKCNFYFAVENPQGISAKAMAVILSESLNGLTPDEISTIKEDIVLDIFGGAISMGKGQGLMSMVQLVKFFANKN